MEFIDLTLPSPEENLALDEALLNGCDQETPKEILRFWQPEQYFVVLGYGCHHTADVILDACAQDRISILRRMSGGGTVLQGPGCLNFSLITALSTGPDSRNITQTNHWIMQQHQAVFRSLLSQEVTVEGITDLAINHLKFSGNAQRRGRYAALFHGSFLINFDIAKISKYLQNPKRQPEYRHQRSHQDFLTNVSLNVQAIKNALQLNWGAYAPLSKIPLKEVERLVREKYSNHGWNLRI
ncbi:MAG: lipoate-protein ligase A related protein [Candidatus Omnitrophica bacterium CG11_big_fil_rev_8_21_14_0_20_45_26]|uniref:Lipoate-protein ligase A related protein n=1 Tax=Candidatus Abzuiibacterium crystallinum TaxID=1974748 RepID=A0A2H0LMM9_9BACT|nr:MAG: lipoate-protein ligase A related protein [Candidatus Omnitrophica bacterium CG11_big_fil_rev_8_21_14_0_20_45_26]PIW65149.1 MAG: lipoate--protein ligase family protein [Candidatus Omnitrophica bacterium CG12_big_fil_rev_8_21_14_0_65_45_16]